MATLTLNSNLPESTTVNEGQSANFEVSVLSGDGSYSYQWYEITSDSTNLPPPTSFTATYVPQEGVQLDWTEPNGDQTEYQIERKRASEPESSYVNIAVKLKGSTSFLDSNAQDSTLYNYRIRSYHTSLIYDPSNWIYTSIETGSPDVLPVPTNFTADNIPQAVELNWTEPDGDQTDYQIERKLSSASTYTYVTSVAKGQSSYIDYGADDDSEAYDYRIRSFNGSPIFVPSAWVYASTEGIPPIPELLPPINF